MCEPETPIVTSPTGVVPVIFSASERTASMSFLNSSISITDHRRIPCEGIVPTPRTRILPDSLNVAIIALIREEPTSMAAIISLFTEWIINCIQIEYEILSFYKGNIHLLGSILRLKNKRIISNMKRVSNFVYKKIKECLFLVQKNTTLL